MKTIYLFYFTLAFTLLSCQPDQDKSDPVESSSSGSNNNSDNAVEQNKQLTDEERRKASFYLFLLDPDVPKIFAPAGSISTDEDFEMAQVKLLESVALDTQPEGLNLQNVGGAIIRQGAKRLPGVAKVGLNGRFAGKKTVTHGVPPTNILARSPDTIILPAKFGTPSATLRGFTDASSAIRSRVNNELTNIAGQGRPKSAAEIAGTGAEEGLEALSFAEFIKLFDPALEPAGDLAVNLAKKGSGVLLYGKGFAGEVVAGTAKWWGTLLGAKAGLGPWAGVGGVSAEVLLAVGKQTAAIRPELRVVFNEVMRVRGNSPELSLSQALKLVEQSPRFQPIVANLRTSGKEIKKTFYEKLSEGAFYTLVFGAARKKLWKAGKADPNSTFVDGEFDDLTILQQRNFEDIVYGTGITKKEIHEIVAGLRPIPENLALKAQQFLKKIEEDAGEAFNDAQRNFEKIEGLSLTNSEDSVQIDIMMLLYDDEGKPLLVLFDGGGNVIRAGQDTFHILHEDEYLIELFGE